MCSTFIWTPLSVVQPETHGPLFSCSELGYALAEYTLDWLEYSSFGRHVFWNYIYYMAIDLNIKTVYFYLIKPTIW